MTEHGFLVLKIRTMSRKTVLELSDIVQVNLLNILA